MNKHFRALFNKESYINILKSKEYRKMLFEVLISLVIVTFGWQLLEVILLGETQKNIVDSIIGIILAYSLYANYTLYTILKNKGAKSQNK